MDEEDFKKLFALTKENNRLLKKVRNSQIMLGWSKVLYWIIISGALVGAFYFLKPYFNSFYNNIQEIQNLLKNISGGAVGLSDSLPEEANYIIELLKNLISN